MALFWGHCLVATILCSPAWALGPENEVPLRPTSWLPDSQVTPVHLPKDRTRRLYFTLRKRSPAMSVTVSPCDVPIEWTLSAKTLKDKPSKNLHWSSKKSVPEVWWRGPGTEAKMHAYAGDAMDTFRGPSRAQDSVYILRLRSRGQNTRATVYLQEGGLDALGAFPELPPDPRVRTLGVGMTSVTLSWSPSDSVPALPRDHHGYRYCVLVDRERNRRSVCAAREAAAEEEEKKKRKRKEEERRSTAWPILEEWWWRQWDSLPGRARDPRCACEGTESVCTVSDLAPDTQYYFDVFVMGAPNGTTAAYVGTSARTHEEARPAVTPLGEGELRWVALGGDGHRGGRLFSFRPRGWRRSALLTAQSCGGRVATVTVSSRGRTLASRPVGPEVMQIWLQGEPSYLVRLEGGDATSPPGRPPSEPAVRLQVSSAYHRQAPPAVPATLRVKSFGKLRHCRSVTLAWLGTEERSLYCVYRRRLDGDGEPGGDDRCLGPESRSGTERVLCKYFQELNPRRAVTTATVGGLEPGEAYVFDVYLMRRWGIPIKYHSKTVRTRKEC